MLDWLCIQAVADIAATRSDRELTTDFAMARTNLHHARGTADTKPWAILVMIVGHEMTRRTHAAMAALDGREADR